MTAHDRSLCWFRRDLRDTDHTALHYARRESRAVYCAFVFDRDILDGLKDRAGRRVEFIVGSVRELAGRLRARGGGLIVLHDRAPAAIPRLARALQVGAVYANRDYEPESARRDVAALRADGVALHLCKDQVIFEADEVLTRAGTPHRVSTPYRNVWLARLDGAALAPHPVAPCAARLAPTPCQDPACGRGSTN